MSKDTVMAALSDPNRAWIVLLIGIVLIIRECLAPGRVFPGVMGAVASTVAIYSLFQHPWRPEALGAILAGLGLLILQAFRHWFWLPAVGAAVLITAGAHWLTMPQIALLPACGAIPLSGITAFLLRSAILARRNKVSIQ